MSKHTLKAQPLRRSHMHRAVALIYKQVNYYADDELWCTENTAMGWLMTMRYSGNAGYTVKTCEVNGDDYHDRVSY
jgi:hypothetical protein